MTQILDLIKSIHLAPFPLFFFGLFVILFYTIWQSKASLEQLFNAINSLGESGWGFMVMMVGVIVFIFSKSNGWDDGAAMLILGWGGKMLTGEIKAVLPNSSMQQTTTVKTQATAEPLASNLEGAPTEKK